MKVGVVGAGGVGACFGARLADAGHEVVLLCRGQHLDAILQNGLVVEQAGKRRAYRLAASAAAEELGPCGFVLLPSSCGRRRRRPRRLAVFLMPVPPSSPCKKWH